MQLSKQEILEKMAEKIASLSIDASKENALNFIVFLKNKNDKLDYVVMTKTEDENIFLINEKWTKTKNKEVKMMISEKKVVDSKNFLEQFSDDIYLIVDNSDYMKRHIEYKDSLTKARDLDIGNFVVKNDAVNELNGNDLNDNEPTKKKKNRATV